MPEIKNREDGPVPGIVYSEIHIPDDSELGTGRFKILLKEDILGKINPVISSVGNEPVFLLLVTINSAINEINVNLGRSEKEKPLSRVIFKLPEDIDSKTTHTIDTSFSGWEVTEVLLDGEKLERIE
jgi:hypothetical protein